MGHLPRTLRLIHPQVLHKSSHGVSLIGYPAESSQYYYPWSYPYLFSSPLSKACLHHLLCSTKLFQYKYSLFYQVIFDSKQIRRFVEIGLLTD